MQRLVAKIAPNSFIATAEGEDYERLHGVIRVLAPFAEFALLGALAVWCWRSYTEKRVFLALPAGGVLLVPIVDELLQSFTAGRAMELTDVLIDVSGGIVGGTFALCTVALVAWLIKRKKAKGLFAMN